MLKAAPAGRQYGNADKLPWREKTMKATSKDKTTFYDNVYDVLRRRKAMFVTPESVLDVLSVMEQCKGPIRDLRPVYGGK